MEPNLAIRPLTLKQFLDLREIVVVCLPNAVHGVALVPPQDAEKQAMMRGVRLS